MAQQGFVKSVKDFFGLLPGQSLVQFATELKSLTYADKLEFAGQLRAQGIDTANPDAPKAVAA